MKYRELYSYEYDDPSWDDITASFSAEWVNKMKTQDWHYPDTLERVGNVPKINKLTTNDAKFKFLAEWDKDKTLYGKHADDVSPLSSMCDSQYRSDSYSYNKSVVYLTDIMLEEYTKLLRDSFVQNNLPPFNSEQEESQHNTTLRKVFDKNDSFQTEAKKRFDDMLWRYFEFGDLCLFTKYRLLNQKEKDELRERLTTKYSDYILSGDWMVIGADKVLQKPKSKIGFVKKHNADDILKQMFVRQGRTLLDEIEAESIKNYRASFIMLNMNPAIVGTMYEDDSIVKLGAFFDQNYAYAAQSFAEYILEMYKLSDILALFATRQSSKKGAEEDDSENQA